MSYKLRTIPMSAHRAVFFAELTGGQKSSLMLADGTIREIVIAPGRWVAEFEGEDYLLTSLDGNNDVISTCKEAANLVFRWFPVDASFSEPTTLADDIRVMQLGSKVRKVQL